MRSLTIFRRKHSYDYAYEIQNDIKVMEKLSNEIKQPQILTYFGYNKVSFYIVEDRHSIGNDCIQWIYEQMKDKLGIDYIYDCLLKCATEDTEATAKINEGMREIFNRQITFLPEIQDMVCARLNEYMQSLKILYDDMSSEERKKKEEREEWRKEWKLVKTYERVLPTKGENGRDGYIDAEYTSQNGVTIRMVSRDVFDFGCYNYPKRVEGFFVLNNENWTEEEKSLSRWISEFGEFRGVRM